MKVDRRGSPPYLTKFVFQRQLFFSKYEVVRATSLLNNGAGQTCAVALPPEQDHTGDTSKLVLGIP